MLVKMANLMRVMPLLCIMTAEATGLYPTLCDVCACSSSLNSSAHIDTTACKVKAVLPEDTGFLSTSRDVTFTLSYLSLTCHSTRWPSLVNSDTMGSMTNLEGLHIENCDLSAGLTESSFQNMTRLRKLSFVDCLLPQTPVGVAPPVYLSPLLNLEILSMTGCKLYRLPALPTGRLLRQLNVSHNSLQILEFVQHVHGHASGNHALAEDGENQPSAGSIDVDELSAREIEGSDRTTGLTLLDASHNPMTSLPTSAIAASPRLEKMVLKGIPLAEFRLPDNLELPELIALDIPDSNLVVFTFRRLCASVKLEELSLQGSGLPVVLNGLSCLTNLTKLSLVNLGLDSTLWHNLTAPNLDTLTLSHNNLGAVHASQYPKLRVLVLDNNQISSVNTSSFTNLQKLLLLNISVNSLTELPSNTFLGTHYLRVLDFSHNQLSHIRFPIFSRMNDLAFLNLVHNEISSVTFNLFLNSVSMKYLFLQHNRIKYLPKLSTMKNLMWLNVSSNNLTTISPRHLYGLSSLTALFANNNSLQRISDRLFSPTPKLTEAWFNNNKINYVGNLGHHRNLRTLRLDFNLIPDFLKGSPFRQLEALTFLSLDNNQIRKVRRFSYPPSLRFLFLSSNYIVWIEPDSFTNLPNLQFVELENNKMIFTLPLAAVNAFRLNYPKPQFLVGGNQFLCDCNMAYLKLLYERPQQYELFLKYYPTFLGLEQTWCQVSYEGIFDRRFKDVPLSDFACPYPDLFCMVGCNCCNNSLSQEDEVPASCPCHLTCPTGCSCYIAGASMQRDYYHIRCDSRKFEQVPRRIPPRAVDLFLDGNNISAVFITDFDRLDQLENLYLNSSAVITLEEDSFTNCTALKYLYLYNNSIQLLHNDTFVGLSSLTHLYLHHNAIAFIFPGALDSLDSLQVLTLHNNRLTRIGSSLGGLPLSLDKLTLSYNPWSCDCQESKDLDDLLYFRSKAIVDKGSVCCFFSEHDHVMSKVGQHKQSSASALLSSSEGLHDGATASGERSLTLDKLLVVRAPRIINSSNPSCLPLWSSDFSLRCGVNNDTDNIWLWSQYTTSSKLPVAVVVLIILAVFLSTAVLFVVFVIFKRKELQALAYAKLGVRILDTKAQVDKADNGSKAFDAFISYSSNDGEFVAEILVPALEDPKLGYRVCVHYRDFPVGSTITDTICKAIESSSRTILLLSQNFLKSEWCRFEFQTAHRHILREGSHRLVIVLYGDIPEDMLDPDLQVHLKSRSFLKFEDPYFWEKLYFALPDIRQRKLAEEHVQRADIGKNGVDLNDVDIQAMAAMRNMRVLTGKPVDNGADVKD